jgi:transcriptional regulator with XRE-family HTH domain
VKPYTLDDWEFYEHIGRRLYNARREAGLTRRQVAQATGRTIGGIRAIEQGEQRLHFRFVVELSRLLGVELATLARPLPTPSAQWLAMAADDDEREPRKPRPRKPKAQKIRPVYLIPVRVFVDRKREIWRVPEGYGRAYMAVSRMETLAPEVVSSLASIGVSVTLAEAQGWQRQRQAEAVVYVQSLRRTTPHPRPEWLAVSLEAAS